jgi:hypothetical protein
MYSLWGGEYFPFTTYNTYSKYRTIRSNPSYYRFSLDPENYLLFPDGHQQEYSWRIKNLIELQEVPYEKIGDSLNLPITIIEKFTIVDDKSLGFYKKEQIYRKPRVQKTR